MWYSQSLLILGCILHLQSVLGLWTCTQDRDCSSLSGGVCVNGGCYCPPGQESVLGGTVCVNLATYHTSTCVEDHQCSRLVTAFECRRTGLEGNCYCRAGFHYFLGRCWPIVEYGGSCSRHEECLSVLRDPFSLSCDTTCQCADGYYSRQRGECRRIASAVGEGCVLDEDCQFVNGACDVETLQCYNVNSGPPNEIETKKNMSRAIDMSTRQEGTACNGTSTCQAPFICTTAGSCVCPVGYYSSPNGNLCYSELGSPTAAPELCVGLFAEVRDGICTCPANFFFEENMRDCTKATRRITDSCVNDRNCFTFGAAARCGAPQPPWSLRTCECVPELAVWDSDRNMCRLFAGIGESCEVDSDCLAGELEIQCVHNDLGEGLCTCPEGLQAIDGLCLTTGLALGDECQATRECTATPNTVCEDGRCSCEAGYVADDDICAPVIGGSCTEDAECVIENTVCESIGNTTTCQCAGGFVESNDLCYPVSTGLNDTCSVTEQCRASMGQAAVCRNTACVCMDSYHYRDGRCWQMTGLFETCSRSSECYLTGISDRVSCRNSLCQCEFHYPYSEELNTCTSSAAASVGNLFILSISLYYLILKQINSDI